MYLNSLHCEIRNGSFACFARTTRSTVPLCSEATIADVLTLPLGVTARPGLQRYQSWRYSNEAYRENTLPLIFYSPRFLVARS